MGQKIGLAMDLRNEERQETQMGDGGEETLKKSSRDVSNPTFRSLSKKISLTQTCHGTRKVEDSASSKRTVRKVSVVFQMDVTPVFFIVSFTHAFYLSCYCVV